MKEWALILENIFPNGIPEYSKWTNLEQIKKVLNKLGSFDNSNHMFYPEGGGLDLAGSSNSNETNCIEIKTAFNEIISPKSLTFHSFENIESSYFRIELNQIPQTKVYDYENEYSEELCEISPLEYISREHWDEHRYDDEPLPPDSRLVMRRLKGTLVIFGKMSAYNSHRSTYDGRHNDYSDEDFRKYIETIQLEGWDK
jgi:serine/threonine-protein kinase